VVTIAIVALALLVVVLIIAVAWLLAALTNERASRDKAIRQARRQSVLGSRAVTLGNVSQQVAPLLPGFPFDPADVQWIGGTTDAVVWDGLASGGEVTVVFLDVKAGRAGLNERQRRIRDAIDAGRVRFQTYRVSAFTASVTGDLRSPEELDSGPAIADDETHGDEECNEQPGYDLGVAEADFGRERTAAA
jgi:hypothetical protein